MFINPYLFFVIHQDKLVAWDYKNGQQFEINETFLARMLELSRCPDSSIKSDLDQELKDVNLIQQAAPYDNWGWDDLSKIFHFGTSLKKEDLADISINDAVEFSKNYLSYSEQTFSSSPNLNIEKNGQAIQLAPPDFSLFKNQNFLSILSARKTCREFYQQEVCGNIVSTLLYTVFGDFHQSSQRDEIAGLKSIGQRKTSPSGGGLHASEAYLIANRVNGLNPGIYHYRSLNHALTLVKEGKFSTQLCELFCGQHYIENLPFGIFITSRFEKLWHKYPHSRAYRVALLDVGHLSQTFQLAATALNLNPWLSGAFIDNEVRNLLNLNEINEQPLFFVGAGYGPWSSIDNVTRNIVQDKR